MVVLGAVDAGAALDEVGPAVVAGASVVAAASVVVGASVVAGVVTTSAEVGAGKPDRVIGGGRVCAAAEEPCWVHDDSSSIVNAGNRSGGVWYAARRFIRIGF